LAWIFVPFRLSPSPLFQYPKALTSPKKESYESSIADHPVRQIRCLPDIPAPVGHVFEHKLFGYPAAEQDDQIIEQIFLDLESSAVLFHGALPRLPCNNP
jgi:hypothetical protein